MDRISYYHQFKEKENKIEFTCDNKEIIDNVNNYIDMLLKAKAYECIQSIPTERTFIRI